MLLITCFFDQCSLDNAIKIGISEFLIKLLIFYLHERIWLQILGKQAITNKELVYKSISWRLIATTTTFVISGMVLNNFDEIALYIALTELFTKFVLYYLHEKLWLRLPLGKIRKMIYRKGKQ